MLLLDDEQHTPTDGSRPDLRPPALVPLPPRTQAREKAQKKATDAQKGKRNDDGKSFKARQEADAAIMRQKQEAAAAKKAAEGGKAK
ncbi:hypothetical protein Rt10032_c11g4661 [Rhodotorula toruloides]|uniref:Small EDRK-rich factor-like N-terminal domain-containing protein n=1 Tax=Rhodotorula toruloides TaxID=5286 RepID=A0A511KMA1_RHOTO|nr:hypothetical protein Rt10032_c11g4661 [Rhodotorula toruloides]